MSVLLKERIALTIGSRDCDYIPKVENAGAIEECGGEKVQIMHNGLKVLYGGYSGEWMVEVIRELNGHHEPQEEKCFHEILKFVQPGTTMLELGSHWAYYSMWFNLEKTGAINYLVEPIKEKLEVGRRNFQLNGLEGHFTNAFVGAKNERNKKFTDWDGSELCLDSIGVDDFARENNISSIEILHSDIQGAELDMLRGADNLLSRKAIRFLFISTHGQKHWPCIRLLKKKGYQILCSHTIYESTSADGLIVAFSGIGDGPASIDIGKASTTFVQKLKTVVQRVLK